MRWVGAPLPPLPDRTVRDWLRIMRRGIPATAVVFGGLAVLLIVRLIERPLFGLRRPVTPWITVGVCRAALRLIGLRRRRVGGPALRSVGAWMANHASWIDIFALNAEAPIYFVAKAEVAGWAGIGWLARATGTVFVVRDPREAARQRDLLHARLRAGHVLCVFPEGTSTDGRRVLAFKPTLFAAFFGPGLPVDLAVQPVTVAYHAPGGARPDIYGWWGDRGFGEHLLAVLAQPRRGLVELRHHAPLPVAEAADRKALARAAEAAVRRGLTASGIPLASDREAAPPGRRTPIDPSAARSR